MTDSEWFDDAGLGLFVHWGLSAVDATGEISWGMMEGRDGPGSPEEYFDLAERFDPDAWEPDSFLAEARAAGFEYAVLTARHHDGFALWPSARGGFSTTEYLDGRDLVGEFVAACRRHGLRVGFYYSLPDWHHPSWPAYARESYEGLYEFTDEPWEVDEVGLEAFEAYRDDVIEQLRELLTRYGEIDLLWFDTPSHFWAGNNDETIGTCYDLARAEQPGIVLNGRDEYDGWGDYTTPENELPERPLDGPWELCQTWGEHWGYVEGDDYRDQGWTLERIARTRARGGNLLLNVGPRADGSLPPEATERLAALGRWMEWGEPSVKRVDPGPWPPRADVPVTRRPAVWYLHVLAGADSEVIVRDVPAPESVRLLRTGEPIEHGHDGSTLSVEVPEELRASPDEVVAVSWSPDDGHLV